VQGIAGILGVLLTGVFVTSGVAGARESEVLIHGLLEGNSGQLTIQAAALGSVLLLGFAGTLLSLFPAKLISGRVRQEAPL
ncbi:MAG: ammonia channel protein, partial [Planctomycetaceae bacterium]